jgi:DHHC palmitoyltransferase
VFLYADNAEGAGGGAGGEESIEDFEGVGGSEGSCKGSESAIGSECSENSGRRKHKHTDRTASIPGAGAGHPRREARVRTVAAPAIGHMECGQCNINRPTTAAHCYECGVCVDQLDHHCPVSCSLL